MVSAVGGREGWPLLEIDSRAQVGDVETRYSCTHLQLCNHLSKSKCSLTMHRLQLLQHNVLRIHCDQFKDCVAEIRLKHSTSKPYYITRLLFLFELKEVLR